jgi:hypothetical protein
MRKTGIIIITIIPLFVYAQAQQISGKIIDEKTSIPLEFVNIQVYNLPDSSFFSGAVTDTLGAFSIVLPKSLFFVKFTSLNYKTVEKNKLVDNEIIKMQMDEIMLSEVTVTAQRPIFKLENNGISADIQNSRLKDVGNVSNILENLPFVRKDGNSFAVFGRGIPLIYINNRLIRDFEELNEINSSDVKKATVITNPSAEYDATVNAVIKIETLKKQGDGFSVNFMNNVIIDRKFSHNKTLGLNYRIKNLDIFGSLRFWQGCDLTNIDIIQQTNTALFVETLKRDEQHWGFRGNTGFNYAMNSKISFGLRYDFNRMPEDIETHTIDITTQTNENKTANKAIQIIDREEKRNQLNAYFMGKIASFADAKINFDYTDGTNGRNQNTESIYTNSTSNIITDGTQKYSLYAVKLTMETPLWEGNLTYGTDYSYTKNNQDYKVNEDGLKSNLQSNNNLSIQNLFAPYLMYDKSFKQIDISLGTRYENIKFDYFEDNIKQKEQSKAYNNWFSTISITYKNERYKMMLGYRKNPRRPSYYELRNNIQYNNQYVYETGNPYLKPAITNSFTYLFSTKLVQLSATYNIQRNFIFLLPQPYIDGIVIYKPENISKRNSVFVACVFSKTIKFWIPTIEFDFAQDFLTYGTPEKTYNRPGFSIDADNAFLFDKNTYFGFKIYYENRNNSGFYLTEPTLTSQIYFSKTFFHNSLKVNLEINDLLKTDKKRSLLINNIYTASTNDQNSRNLTISISYRFNSVKSKYKGEKATDELNRL